MKKIIILAVMAILLSPLCALAATTGAANVTLTIPPIMDITLDAGAVTVFPAVATLTELTAGQMTGIAGGNIIVNTNKTWSLSVHASSATFTGTGNNKAVSALQVEVAPAGAYIALNGATDVPVSAALMPKEAAVAHAVLYQFAAGYLDSAGTYITTITYTIAD